MNNEKQIVHSISGLALGECILICRDFPDLCANTFLHIGHVRAFKDIVLVFRVVLCGIVLKKNGFYFPITFGEFLLFTFAECFIRGM